MVLAADSPMVTELGEFNSIPIIDNDIVYEGAMVGESAAIATAGYGRPLTAGDRFMGHAIEQVDNTLAGHAAGAKNIRLRTRRYKALVTLAGYITDIGQPVYASDDATLTFDAVDNSYVGVVHRYVSTTKMVVEFRPGEQDEWGNRTRLKKIDDYTTLAIDAGVVIYLGVDTKIITLFDLATALAGYRITIVNSGAAGVAGIVVDPNANDLFVGGSEIAANANGHKMTNTKATAKRGDFLTLVSEGTNGFYIEAYRGIWAAE
jgi:hypothetical protein